MSQFTFPLPDVGEGLTEAEIVSWRVKPGDEVRVNQVVCEIETAKSLVELPSPFQGVVKELLVNEGDTVLVGTPIISVEGEGGDSEPDAGVTDAVGDVESSVTQEAAEPKNLVGYGTGPTTPTSRRKRAQAPADAPVVTPAPVAGTDLPLAESMPVIAKPPIRKLAKDLGVSLDSVTGSGIGGEILRDDVIRHAGQATVFRNLATPEWPENREDRIPVKGVRKAIAQAMVKSMFTAPHVSVFVDVDATRTMDFVKRLKASPDFAGIKVSPLLVMVKAMIWAVQRNPTVNSTWTEEEIIVHHFVNMGVAAATPRGLIVPNVKEAQSLSLRDLAMALEKLTVTAREGKTTPEEMSGGTITITNLGSFGVDTGTPILNPGEVTIVALGTIKPKPWVVNGEIRARMVTTVAASFDHRVVDGDVASKFVADVAAVMEEPALLLD
ncbi:MAG: dihydrolipoamide acetyltransferase family protein [Actinomycetota bacterium]|nr:dihydrolipoamide acetyltransferase family protein [Actinomycetota bacterium]MDA2980596.1 dihydrolipoamide acetyltransferase family protein [Actinomycetota bacterium]